MIDLKVKQMESDLNSLTESNPVKMDIMCWKGMVKDKLSEIRNDIELLDEYQKKLKNKKLSLENEIKTLNHQINEMERDKDKTQMIVAKTASKPKRSVSSK